MTILKIKIRRIIAIHFPCITILYLLLLGCTAFPGCTELERDYRDNSETSVNNFSDSAEKITFPNASGKILAPPQYRNWVLENCLKEKRFNDVYFKLLYKPHDFIICSEDESSTISSSQRKKINDELGQMEYFELRIGLTSSNGDLLKYRSVNDQEYENRVKYFAFKFENAISLITYAGDTIQPALFHFERAYDVTPYCTFSLGFPSDKINYNEPFALSIKDSVFKAGTIRFVIPAKQFLQLPKLKTI